MPSRFPPVTAFDWVSSNDELELLYSVEGMTNDRLADELGWLDLVPRSDRVVGPGTTPVMAAFTHPSISRFSNGTYGVYYCAGDELTARRETAYHRARFMRENRLPAMALDMREYVGSLGAELYDLGGRKHLDTAIYDPHDYTAGQAIATALRDNDGWGIVYDSVRDARDLPCAAVFRPPALGPVHQRRQLAYDWDGFRISAMRSVEHLAM